MRKILIGLFSICIMGLMGCPKPVKKTEAEIEDIDAKALQNCYANSSAGGGGGTNTYHASQTGVAESTLCQQKAADESQAAKDGDAEERSTNRDMPIDLILTTNPFEEDGRMHNAILDIYFEYANTEDFNTELKNYNVAAYTKIFNKSIYKDQYFQNPQSIVNTLQENHVVEQLEAATQQPTLSVEIQQFDDYVNQYCKSMKLDGKSKYERATFLNSEITNILNAVPAETELTKEQVLKLVYLTTYKYSMYYWKDRL